MTGEEMAVKLAETEARSKSNTHRLDHLEKSTEAINRLATSVEVMAKEQKHQTEAIKGLKPTSPISPARWRRSKRSRGTAGKPSSRK